MSMAGAGSMISESRWLTFFDSQLCSVRCGDQFGLEFHWKGALNPVQRFRGGIGAVGWILVFFFSLRAWVSPESSVQPLLFLKRNMFLFSCAYACAYVACVMLIAQVWTRLKSCTWNKMLKTEPPEPGQPNVTLALFKYFRSLWV